MIGQKKGMGGIVTDSLETAVIMSGINGVFSMWNKATEIEKTEIGVCVLNDGD